ncbi:MAG TPA: serine hydrolase domain-containing protein [Chitinophagaceae bacterium]|nr:serine hydrolase domain-containing protein [Chitinophagaceae bacterium]
MYKFIFPGLFFIFLTSSCRRENNGNTQDSYNCEFSFPDSSAVNLKNNLYQQLLSGITLSGVPGIEMSIHQPGDGLWMGASGKSDLRNDVPMKPCHILRMGSTVKTFTAVTILKLKEEGRLNLDDKAAIYLPSWAIQNIANADKATIRQLLNHSSGIYNYIQNAHFQTASLNDLLKEWSPKELLDYARGKKAYFHEGADVYYSNTNYIFLGMIIEQICGKPFWETFHEKVFAPLGLTATLFAATDKVPRNIVRGYVDFFSNLQVVDATSFSGWDYFTADGGLISNVYDMNIFLRNLFAGNIINTASLTEMLTTIPPLNTESDFFPIQYGLGIFKISTSFGDAYMHSGDAIGYNASMLYFPASQTTLVWAVNGNYGKIDQFVSSKDAMNKIFDVIF